MGYSTVFEVLTMPLTLNEVMAKHWRFRHKNFEAIKEEIAHNLIVLKRPLKPLEKASIEIERHSSGTLDRDNAYFTAKPVLDALVREGILLDDGFEMIKRITIDQIKIKRGEQKRLIITVREIE
jgi:hypothetical protein